MTTACDAPTVTWDREFDLLVLGSGAAGLGAAVIGADEGLSVLVLEKTEWLGGTTAYSAGTCWIPGHPHTADPAADTAAASCYLDALVGDRAPRALREAYLAAGPQMLERLDRIGVRFRHSGTVVDYHPELPGHGVGRALEPHDYDGRRLGKARFGRIRRPVPEFALLGGTLMVRRAEVDALLGIFSGSVRDRVRGAALALRLGARWARDRVRHPRGTRLVMGNALVANLYQRLLDRHGQVWFTARTDELVVEGGRVVGAVAAHRGRTVRIGARRGVVLAAGGFAASPELRARHLPRPVPQFTRAAEGSTGDSIALAGAAGGVLGESHGDNGLWFPSSIGRRRDGSTVVFPHIWDRAKPGIVAVNAAGRRFVDESVPYHHFTRAMYASHESIPAWLVVDARTLRRYGLGMIRPHTPDALLRRHLAGGYLRSGRTVRELAAQIDVDPDGLELTVAAAGRAARTGVDEEFGKGESPFGRQHGDPDHTPNVNLGPIEVAPFYAVAVVPTPLASALGLRTDADARVLTATGEPVPGLYACGNDANSVLAAEYPGAGCQVGAGLTFGYLAARHAASGGGGEWHARSRVEARS
jgi:succinate dehydrogenase/fumarate reductase flavoprotein subunit